MRMRACARTHASMPHIPLHASHLNGDKDLGFSPCLTPSLTYLTEGFEVAEMEASRLIRCTESNAGDFLAIVKAWPELQTLVRDLQAAELFPGLRCLSLTLTGSPEYLAKGLAAFNTEIGSQAARGTHAR